MEILERVRAAVRVRKRSGGPPADPDDGDDPAQIVVTGNETTVRIRSRNNKGVLEFTADAVFGENSTQQEVYDGCVERLIRGVESGFNTTVLAYGQTGTGKTFTMLGEGLEARLLSDTRPLDQQSVEPSWGVIPRCIFDLFQRLELLWINGRRRADVTCSYCQIYQEKLYDALTDARLQVCN